MYMLLRFMYISWRLWFGLARFRTVVFLSHCRGCVRSSARKTTTLLSLIAFNLALRGGSTLHPTDFPKPSAIRSTYGRL